MFIDAETANPRVNPDGTGLVRTTNPARTYDTPLIVHATHKRTLKDFFRQHKGSTCRGATAVKVFYGRYRQQRGKGVESAVRSDTDWLKDVMLAKYGYPGLTEALMELLTKRRKFVLISTRSRQEDPRLFRHQLSVVRLHETVYPQTSVTFATVHRVLSGEAAATATGTQWAVRMGRAPDQVPDYWGAIEASFEMSKIDIDP